MRHIAEDHGSTIAVVSAESVGTMVIVRLLVAAPGAAEMHASLFQVVQNCWGER
jgi:hypothetical protein